MAQILTAIYLLMMLAGGWRLFGLGWPLWVKGLVAIGLVCPLPLLVLLPGMLHKKKKVTEII